MDEPTPGYSPSALHVHAIKTPTFDDDGLAPPCSQDEDDAATSDYTTKNIAENLKSHLRQDFMNYRFFGKSSGVMLIQTAIDLKNEYVGIASELPIKRPMVGLKRPEFWNVRPVCRFVI